jgi:hypothetical protein
MISLEHLLRKFKAHGNFEYEGRSFMTHVPSAGPCAYLNIIFAPAIPLVQKEIIDPLQLPDDLRAFYHKYNGADLFLHLVSVYGFLPAVYKFERSDWRKTLPYNLVNSNREYSNNLELSNVILVGSYGYDRSEVYVERETGHVHCSIANDLTKTRATWPSFEVWLTEEIARLSDCFDEHGNRLVELEETLPGGT